MKWMQKNDVIITIIILLLRQCSLPHMCGQIPLPFSNGWPSKACSSPARVDGYFIVCIESSFGDTSREFQFCNQSINLHQTITRVPLPRFLLSIYGNIFSSLTQIMEREWNTVLTIIRSQPNKLVYSLFLIE